MLIHSGWIAAAFLAGVLLTSWLKERRPSLKARVRKAAVFRGKTCHEVIREMKTPQRTIQMPDGRIRRIWMENGYRISLLFDAKDLCLGVEEEQEGKENRGSDVQGTMRPSGKGSLSRRFAQFGRMEEEKKEEGREI